MTATITAGNYSVSQWCTALETYLNNNTGSSIVYVVVADSNTGLINISTATGGKTFLLKFATSDNLFYKAFGIDNVDGSGYANTLTGSYPANTSFISTIYIYSTLSSIRSFKDTSKNNIFQIVPVQSTPYFTIIEYEPNKSVVHVVDRIGGNHSFRLTDENGSVLTLGKNQDWTIIININ